MSQTSLDLRRYLSTGQVARILGGPCRRTIIRWCEDGVLAGAVQPGPGRRWLIPRDAIAHLRGVASSAAATAGALLGLGGYAWRK